MKHIAILLLSVMAFTRLNGQKVVLTKIDGMINPVAANFIHRALGKAQSLKAECLIIQLNTPGGLLKSTREIVSDILEAQVPVVVYVSPSGAQDGSAGVFITLAAHIAAMAPGTNIGAAHPVGFQGEADSIMNAKATNDAAAFIHTIAERRNRNWQWAEEAVRFSISVTETEALKDRVIDTIAQNIPDLLTKINGKTVNLETGAVTLNTKGAEIVSIDMDWQEKLLDKISDPNIAYILMLLGMFGLLFELYNPGAILPGIVGVVSLVLAFYAMHSLPVNYAGFILIVFALVLFLLELKIASHGMLAIGGIASLLTGSFLLIHAESALEFVTLSRSVIITATLVTTFFFLFVIGVGVKAQRRKPVTGMEGLINETGESLEVLDPSGTVRVHGEIWQAESIDGKIEKGQKVQIVSVWNLKVQVKHSLI